MASITIRNLDDETKERLRRRAASHKRSMEEEARTMLRQALAVPDASGPSLAASIHARFKALGGIDLELPAREAAGLRGLRSRADQSVAGLTARAPLSSPESARG